MNKLSRRQTRVIAVQILYQLINAQEYFTVDKARDYTLEAGMFPDEGLSEIDDDYLKVLVNGVENNLQEIDQKINTYLQDWTLERIANIDLTILRLAFFELFYLAEEEIPAKVAVNEAIDLTKVFSDDKSRIFVSGLLAKVLSDIKE